MNIRLNTLMRSGNGPYRLINAALSVAAVICAAALLTALLQPVYALNDDGVKTKKTARLGPERVDEPRSAYNVTVEKDLFRQDRQKYAPRPMVARPSAPKPPPKLALIGTVLGGGSEAAIMDYPAGGQKISFYRVGDNIEGFVITEIREDSVLLKREGESLRVDMRQSIPFLPSDPNTPAVNTTPSRLRPQAVMTLPPEPSPQAR